MQTKSYTLKELADFLSAKLHGDPATVIYSIAPLQVAHSGQITFLDNPRYRKFLPLTQASAVIISEDILSKCPTAALVVDNPYTAYARIASLFEKKPPVTPGIHPTAVIGEGCRIDASVSIGPQVVIGNHVDIGPHTVIQAGCVVGDHTTIGEHCWLYPNVSIYHAVVIANRVIAHSGVVIGSDGFGFAFHQGTYHKIPQIGSVQIGDDVEIGANTTIDRGALGDTVIEKGVKLDNQIQIGHNVQVGAHTVIAGGTGVAGSTRIGKYCRIGGMVGFAGHIDIADNVVITAMSGVAQAIDTAGVYSAGVPAAPSHLWRRNMARFQQLDAMARRLNEIERRLGEKAEEESE